MRRIKRILEAKGHDIWSVEPSATVYEAIHLLAEKKIGALLVMKKDQLVGIFSERDLNCGKRGFDYNPCANHPDDCISIRREAVRSNSKAPLPSVKISAGATSAEQ